MKAKNKRLNLEELKVDSFITNLDKDNSKTLNGGAVNVPSFITKWESNNVVETFYYETSVLKQLTTESAAGTTTVIATPIAISTAVYVVSWVSANNYTILMSEDADTNPIASWATLTKNWLSWVKDNF